MRVLAIDTALGATSACVLVGGDVEPIAAETLLMERGHAEALVPLIERVMARVSGGFEALDRVAVTIGPGSFTGIRVGVAAARAIGLACHVPVVGVSVLACLAASLGSQEGVAAAALDARHGSIYFQPFAGGKAVAPARFCGLMDAVRTLGNGPVRLIGSAAPALAREARHAGFRVETVATPAAPEIAYVAKLGIAASPEAAPPRPLYLKAPDARPQDEGRIPRI